MRYSKIVAALLPKVKEVRPNVETHPAFGVAWQEAVAAGVRIWFLGCEVSEDALAIDRERVLTTN